MTYFNLHTHKFTNNAFVIELVNQYPWNFDNLPNYYSIGIHPWYIDKDRLKLDLEFMQNKLKSTNCLAIGECGLDKRIDIDFDLQLEVFEIQLVMAQKHNKPVVVHCVAAFDELIAIKNRLKISIPIIIHGFSKSIQLSKQLIANGFYLSFGKNLLRKPELELVFKDIPNNRFFLETDMIDENIFEVYTRASQYKNINTAQLQALIQLNFEAVFGKLL